MCTGSKDYIVLYGKVKAHFIQEREAAAALAGIARCPGSAGRMKPDEIKGLWLGLAGVTIFALT
ncbi:MAG TPA: hypothetical protein VGA59_10570, partial [Ramlibacter sp.]